MTHEQIAFFTTASARSWPALPSSAQLNAFSKLAKQNCLMLWTKGAGMRMAPPNEISGFWTAWSDGSFEPQARRSAIGGVLRDASGAPVALFSRQSRVSHLDVGPLEAERSALLEALAVAADAGARRLEVRFDCLPLLMRVLRFERVQQEPESLTAADDLALALQRFDEVAFRWIPRGKNQLADALSKRPSGRGALCGGSAAREVFDRSLVTGEDFPLPERRAESSAPKAPKQPPLASWAIASCWTPGSGWLSACAMLVKGESKGQRAVQLPKTKSLWWADSATGGAQGAIDSLAQAFALRSERDAPKIPPGAAFTVAINPVIHDWLEGLDALPELEARLAEAIAKRSPGAIARLAPDEKLGGGLEEMIWTQKSNPSAAFAQQERALLAREGKAPPREPKPPAQKLTEPQRREQASVKTQLALREKYRLEEALARQARLTPTPRVN